MVTSKETATVGSNNEFDRSFEFYRDMGEALERCGFTPERANAISVKIIRDNHADDVMTSEEMEMVSSEAMGLWTRYEDRSSQ